MFDPEKLRSLVPMDADLEARLLESFLRSHDEQIARLSSALEQEPATGSAITDAAHRLKSGASSVGDEDLAALAHNTESPDGETSASERREIAARLLKGAKKLRAEIAAHLESLPESDK